MWTDDFNRILVQSIKNCMFNCYQTYLLYSRDIQKRGLGKKSKVYTLDTQIKRSGLRISHSKAFSSDEIWEIPTPFLWGGVYPFSSTPTTFLIWERLIFFNEKLAVCPLFTSVTGIRFRCMDFTKIKSNKIKWNQIRLSWCSPSMSLTRSD